MQNDKTRGKAIKALDLAISAGSNMTSSNICKLQRASIREYALHNDGEGWRRYSSREIGRLIDVLRALVARENRRAARAARRARKSRRGW